VKVSSIAQSGAPVAVWDGSVRVLHWALATSTVAALASGFAGAAWFGLHKACGALILGLSVTRLVLGFAGSTTAKFGEFVRGPTEIWRYVRSLARASHRRHFGHNPLGALMIVALMGCILVQGTLGLYASDGIATEGPFAQRIDDHLADAFGALHGKIALVIIALACIHVAAVAAYRLVWNLDLIGPMISGHAPADSFVSVPEQRQPGLQAWKVVLVAAISLVASCLIAFA
jgi:cytochrome b